MFRLKRAYEKPSREDGSRILVERLWPRGLTKERAAVGLWLKEGVALRGVSRGDSTDTGRIPEPLRAQPATRQRLHKARWQWPVYAGAGRGSARGGYQ